MTDFIINYLERRLIHVGDNEERLTQLRDAAATLAEQFIERRNLLLQFLRVTLVESVDPTSSVLAEIEDLIKGDWPTFVSFESDRQVPIQISVGWHAVMLAVAKDAELSRAVWYGSVNLLQQGNIDPMSDPAIDFLKEQGEIVEKAACQQWALRIEVAGKQVKAIEAPKGPSIAGLLEATSNVKADNTPLEGGNPHPLPPIGPWANHFASHAATAINVSVKSYGDAIIGAVQDSFNELNKKFGSLKKDFVRIHQAQSRRTELLWLAESRYSLRLKKGYCEVTPKESIIMLAYDVAEIARENSPQSVEFFLSEVVNKVASTKPIKVETFVKELSKSEVLESLSEVMFEPVSGVNRLGLIEFIGAVRDRTITLADFVERTGFNKTDSKTPSELARWLYREIKCLECIRGGLWQ